MILSDVETAEAVLAGRLVVDPYLEERQQPASYDLTLSASIAVPAAAFTTVEAVDLRGSSAGLWEQSEIPREGFTLDPLGFVLASTVETVGLPSHMVGRVEGKSSLARLGLQVHCAGFVDPGFKGQITLELFNMSPHPILLTPGIPIAQLAVELMGRHVARPYGSDGLNSKYQGQKGATPSRFHENFTAS